MSGLRTLFKHTFIYGLATVLPRIISVILTPLYVYQLPKSDYGIYSVLMVYLILGNVLLSYGMETAFFRFMNREENPQKVQSTALTSVTLTTLVFFIVAWFLREHIAHYLNYEVAFIQYAIAILALDALVVIPFAWFRNAGKPVAYAAIKIGNVLVNLFLNLFFFLVLPKMALGEPMASYFDFENKVHYIFIANLVASLLTFLVLLPLYVKIKFAFYPRLWRAMFAYAFPVLIAGIAFSINEGFDRVFLRKLLPSETADATIGIYAACYKLGMFMTLFVTAYKLGVEPFFFNKSRDKSAPQTYATITYYFTIFGAFVLLFITVYTDLFKRILVPDPAYWEALWIVPVILLANLCLGIYHSLSVWYKITDRTSYGAYISIFGAIVTLVGNYALIPILSYKGAALATLLAYGTMMLLSYFIGQYKYPIPYPMKKIGLFLGVSIGASVLAFYVFDRNLWVGSFFVVGYLFLMFSLEGKQLIRLANSRG